MYSLFLLTFRTHEIINILQVFQNVKFDSYPLFLKSKLYLDAKAGKEKSSAKGAEKVPKTISPEPTSTVAAVSEDSKTVLTKPVSAAKTIVVCRCVISTLRRPLYFLFLLFCASFIDAISNFCFREG